MKGKIVLNLAMSIDGYIADKEGGFDWIVGQGDTTLDTKNKWDYGQFLEEIDVVVMGKNCYDQGFHKDFQGKEVYIATTKELEDYDNYHFINRDVCETISDLRDAGKNIFLFGGGVLIDYFVKADSIDEYIVGIIPTILGEGRKLFLENNPKIELALKYYSVMDGTVIMKYSKRNK